MRKMKIYFLENAFVPFLLLSINKRRHIYEVAIQSLNKIPQANSPAFRTPAAFPIK
jgi:hypothetical protein